MASLINSTKNSNKNEHKSFTNTSEKVNRMGEFSTHSMKPKTSKERKSQAKSLLITGRKNNLNKN
jgi:hypothetical protein